MTSIPVALAYGTRPEAIKLAPVVRALDESATLRPVVAVSGQHREMLDQVHRRFGITSDVDLNLMRAGQTLADLTGSALTGFSGFLEARPEIAVVVVQGDTTTAMAAALAAFYQRRLVVHVEAGLRTGDRRSPYPEEVNRRLISQLADLHLAPTPLAGERLLAEGHDPSRVLVTGNTVIDALHQAVALEDSTGDVLLDLAVEQAVAERRKIVLVTAHRRESWGEPMRQIGRAVARVAQERPDVLVVLPVHRNPVVRESLVATVDHVPNVMVTEPLDYGPFAYLVSRSTLVLTDSGGIQEEAPSLGVPVLVMRDTTERPEAVAAGAARLVGTDSAAIAGAALTLLDGGPEFTAMQRAGSPFGDGQAARRTEAAIAHLVGLGDRPDEFVPNKALDERVR